MCRHIRTTSKTMIDKHFLPVILLLATSLAAFAESPTECLFTKGDTIQYSAEYNVVERSDAPYWGVVTTVDTVDNMATIRVFDKENNQLKAILKRIVSGEKAGKQIGKQLYFRPDGTVEKMDLYGLIRDEKRNKLLSVKVSETLLYPDGTTMEEVKPMPSHSYIFPTYQRKCFYPSGAIQWEESYDGKKRTVTCFNEKGKIIKNPKQKLAPYMTHPAFPGGQEELFSFLSNNVHYPAECQEKGIQGRVICQFVVDFDGTVKDVSVVKSGGHPLLDQEAMRVLNAMPRWQPGTMRGKPIRVQHTLPVNFRLQ